MSISSCAFPSASQGTVANGTAFRGLFAPSVLCLRYTKVALFLYVRSTCSVQAWQHFLLPLIGRLCRSLNERTSFFSFGTILQMDSGGLLSFQYTCIFCPTYCPLDDLGQTIDPLLGTTEYVANDEMTTYERRFVFSNCNVKSAVFLYYIAKTPSIKDQHIELGLEASHEVALLDTASEEISSI
jgi:hypothetical protein